MRPERRACLRFTVPGAVVDWQTEPATAAYGSSSTVGDVSRGGLRFFAPGPPPLRARVLILLRVPGEPPLELRGRAVWTEISSGQIHSIGVEFLPFGDLADANPPAALDRLTALEKQSAPDPA